MKTVRTFLVTRLGSTMAGLVLLTLATWVIAATKEGFKSATPTAEGSADRPTAADRATNGVKLRPGPQDVHITKMASRILESHHYSRQHFDEKVSSKFLDQYLNALDPQHLIFLQSDVDEFGKYRTQLNELTMRFGDTTPATVIFNRFMERFDQQIAFVSALLKTNQFTFTTQDRYPLNRREMPRPKDMEEARRLWTDRVRWEYLEEKLGKKKPEEIMDTVSRRYTRMYRFWKEYDSDDVLQIYLTALANVYDPHSDYMGRATMENFAIGMKLSLFGIGAVLQSEDGYCKIRELQPGPAQKSGKIKPNDRIVAVAQGEGAFVDVVDMKLSKVVDLIRGPKGTVVRLKLIPADATDTSTRKTVVLVRDEIKLASHEAKAKVIELPNSQGTRLGLIELPTFYSEIPSNGRTENLKSTTADVARLIRKLKQEKVEGILLDLRNNGGGSLEEAIRLTGLFIKQGPIVQVKDSRGTIDVDDDPDPSILYEGPLVVLTSRHSASASEILAGALQDYGRALIVGDISTHGKGTVQQLIPLEPIFRQFGLGSTNNPGTLKITVRKFYRATGSSTQRKGVVPDIILPSVNNYGEVGEDSLPNALPWDTIPSAKFEPMKLTAPYLAQLQKRSTERTTKDPDFIYLRNEIERFRKAQAEKSVSLNEEERRQKKAETEARLEARKKDLRERADTGTKVYEVTLQQVDLPGLPPPVKKTNQVASVKSHPAPGAAQESASVASTQATKTEPTDNNSTSDDQDDEKGETDNVPEVDMTLTEAERILLDFIAFSTEKPVLMESVRFVR